MANLTFPLALLVVMFLALVAEHFVPAVSAIGARVFLMPLVMFYGAAALPLWGMLFLAFCGGLMWDLLHTQIIEGHAEIALGWSVVLYAILGAIISGFRPWFLRGYWFIHCFVCAFCVALIPLAEYCMVSIRRLPVAFAFDREIWWRIGGSGIAALFLAPFFFFALNYLGALLGYDPNPAPDEEPR